MISRPLHLLGAPLGLLLLLPLAPAPAPARSGEPLADFAFLSGRWVLERGEGDERERIEETWSPATGDAMVGMLRFARGGRVAMFELMSLEATADGPRLVLRHFSRGLKPWKSEADPETGALIWKLAERGEQHAVFTAPAPASVRRVRYEREEDHLTVTLESDDAPRREFRFRRAS